MFSVCLCVCLSVCLSVCALRFLWDIFSESKLYLWNFGEYFLWDIFSESKLYLWNFLIIFRTSFNIVNFNLHDSTSNSTSTEFLWILWNVVFFFCILGFFEIIQVFSNIMKTSPLGGDNPRLHWGECAPAGGALFKKISLIAFFWASLSDEGGPMPYRYQEVPQFWVPKWAILPKCQDLYFFS